MEPGPHGSVIRHGIEQQGTVRRDAVTISPHGFDVTHVDAWSHVATEAAGARRSDPADDAETDRQLGVHRLAGGVLTRGVLLDVASANGLAALPPGFVITPDQLDKAVEQDNKPTPGCAVFVRAGIRATRGAVPPRAKHPRPGLSLDCSRWLEQHEVAVYAGDCIEAMPAEHQPQPYPLHAACLGELGLVWLDNPDIERLREACELYGRREFAVVLAPLPLIGMTGCAVNPLAVF